MIGDFRAWYASVPQCWKPVVDGEAFNGLNLTFFNAESYGTPIMSIIDCPKSAAFINRSCNCRVLSSIDHAIVGCFHQSITINLWSAKCAKIHQIYSHGSAMSFVWLQLHHQLFLTIAVSRFSIASTVSFIRRDINFNRIDHF